MAWFSGAVPDDASTFEEGFLRRLDPEFLLIPPAGATADLTQLAETIRGAHGTNPDFRIAIRNTTVRRAWEGHVLVTYEEWQRNALASTPPDNGRVASALFRSSEGLTWLHVHETWLPRAIMDAGPYDF